MMGKLISGCGLFCLALLMLLGFFNATPDVGPMVIVFTLLLTVGLPAAGGAALVYSHVKQRREQRDTLSGRKALLRQRTLEAELLKLAERKGGKLTVVEVVSETAVDAEAAKAALESLTAQGFAQVELTDSGVIVYAFYDIQHLPDKSSSKGVLDA